MTARSWNVAQGNFNDPNSWSPTGAPQAGDSVVLADGTATIDPGSTLDGYEITAGGPTSDLPIFVFTGDATFGTDFTLADTGEGFNLTITGTLTNDGFFILNTLDTGALDTIQGNNGPARFVNNGLIASTGGGGISDPGVIIGGPGFGGGGAVVNTATFTNNGTLDLSNGLIRVGISPGPGVDSTTFDGTGLVRLATHSVFEVDGLATGNTIEFEDGFTNHLILDAPTLFQDTITGFRPGDFIELPLVNLLASPDELGPGSPLVGGTPSFSYQNGVLSIALNGQHYADLKLVGNYTSSDFTYVAPNGSLAIELACFAAGTRIATSRGEIAVENLAVGDLALTVAGDLRPIRWIGSRNIDCASLATPWRGWPILIRSDAFADGWPHRDLYLSREHAVLMDGVLVPVGVLVNGLNIVQVPYDGITYFHVELETHDILIAEGLPAESFLDTGGRDIMAGASLIDPNVATSRVWEAKAIAKREVATAAVRALRAALLSRWKGASPRPSEPASRRAA